MCMYFIVISHAVCIGRRVQRFVYKLKRVYQTYPGSRGKEGGGQRKQMDFENILDI